LEHVNGGSKSLLLVVWTILWVLSLGCGGGGGGGGGSGLKSESSCFFPPFWEKRRSESIPVGSGGFKKNFDLLHSGWFYYFHEDCLEVQRNLIPSSPTEIQKSRQDDNNARKFPV
jgi:hypothetical protein